MSEMNEIDPSRGTAFSRLSLVNIPLVPDIQAARLGLCAAGVIDRDSEDRAQACPEAHPDQFSFVQELERERRRIAMDLHDGLGPLITLIRLELQNAKILMGKQSGALDLARGAIERAEENVARTFDELRRTVLDLRPAVLDDLGIVPALRWLIRQFEMSGTDVIIQSELTADEGAVPVALKIVIFRICQETLNNVIKHANASHVAVKLETSGEELLLSIKDDGGGMAAATPNGFNRSGGGLIGIASRANSSKGQLTVDSAGGSGTRITIRWHLAALTYGAATPASGKEKPSASITA